MNKEIFDSNSDDEEVKNARDGGTMPMNKKKIVSAIKVRLNRKKGISKIQQEVMDDLSKYSDEQLYELPFIFAPTVGLSSAWMRRALDIYFCTIIKKDRFAGSLRAILIDAMNLYALPRKIKDFAIDITIKGMVNDGVELHKIIFAKSVVKGDEVGFKKNMGKPDVMYDNILKLFSEARAGEGDVFKLAQESDSLDKVSKSYFSDVEKQAGFMVSQVSKIIDYHVNSKTDRNNMPISRTGFLSKYCSSDMKGKSSNEIFAHVIHDVAEFTDTDFEEFAKINKDFLFKKLSKELTEKKENSK